MFPLEQRRRLWAWHYAHLSFTNCKNCCEFITKEKLTNKSPIYYRLTTAIYVLYARPFIKSYGLDKLSELIVPKNQKSLHKHLLAERNKLYAHLDTANPSVSDGISSVDVRIKTLVNGGLIVEALESPPLREGFEKIVILTDELLKKCHYQSLKIINQHSADLPKQVGTFHLSIQDETPAFSPSKNNF